MDARTVAELSDLNYHETLREQARRAGGAAHDEGGLLLVAGAHPHPMLNNAVRTDPGLAPSRVLERAAAFFGARGRRYALMLRDAERDRELYEMAVAGGMTELLGPPAMVLRARPAEPPVPSGMQIRLVRDADDVRDFAAVATDAWSTYGLPPEMVNSVFACPEQMLAPHFVCMTAYDGARPVAGALVVLSHGIAGVYWVSAREAVRGRGLGAACTAAVARAGFDRGAAFVSLQATPMGEPVYRRLGFSEIFRYRILVAGGA
jgi:ribosomal protein S18 acetylase RimI-like enzyme